MSAPTSLTALGFLDASICTAVTTNHNNDIGKVLEKCERTKVPSFWIYVLPFSDCACGIPTDLFRPTATGPRVGGSD